MRLRAAALAMMLALAGCGDGTYDDITELRDAAIDAGLTCPLADWKIVGDDNATGSCGNARVVQLNETNYLTVPMAQDSVNARRTPPTGILVSEKWVIYAPWSEVLMIQNEMGGNATNLQPQR